MKTLATQIIKLEQELKGIKNPAIKSFAKNLIKKKKNQLRLLTPYHAK